MKVSSLAALLVLAAAPALAQDNKPEGAAASPSPAGDAKAADAATAQEKPTKVFAGAGLGGGFGGRAKFNGRSVSFDDQLSSRTDKTPLVAVNVASFGIAMRPGLYAGIDLTGFGQTATALNGDKRHLQITNYFAALTWFPWETGLFLRGGAGLSQFLTNTGSTTEHSGGLGLLVAAGYALQLTGAHHLSLTVEQTWQSYGGSSATKPDSSQVGAVILGYMWKP
ncbi:MAG TPA: hypothetical protein VMS53_01115 [Burkholderiales bacterium]|nr:hypothetical protein [Burkholderiales bacterium]